MSYLIPFLFAVLISTVLTGVLRGIGIRYKIVSFPRNRDIHTKPIPRIGGPAIFFSFLVISLMSFVVFSDKVNFVNVKVLGIDERLFGILVGSFFITVVMVFDDIKGLKP